MLLIVTVDVVVIVAIAISIVKAMVTSTYSFLTSA
jgi:hypothetical protein